MAFHRTPVDAPEFKLLSSDSRRVSSDALANQLTAAVDEAAGSGASEDELEELLWRLWNAILATASRTPAGEQQYLSDLLRNISMRGELRSGQGEMVRVWDAVVWRELPVFGAAVREVFNSDEIIDEEEQEQWININAFLARLTVDSAIDGPGGARDFSLFGIWSLREALETKDTQPPSYKIESARSWMDIAGTLIKELSRDSKSYDGKLAAPGQGYAGNSWNGYNDERLEIWLKKLGRT